MTTERVDALVIVGAPGDLAKLGTFPALVGLGDRGVLDVPVVGVAKSGWGLDQFRDYAAVSLRLNGMDPDSRSQRAMVGLLGYVDGDLDEEATYTLMSQKIGSGTRALFYLEVPPVLFGRIVRSISGAGRADGAWVMVEKPFRPDLAGVQQLNRDHVDNIQITMEEAFDVAELVDVRARSRRASFRATSAAVLAGRGPDPQLRLLMSGSRTACRRIRSLKLARDPVAVSGGCSSVSEGDTSH